MGRPRISEEEYARRIKERFPLEDFEILQYESLGQQAVLLCKQCQNKIEVSKATNFLAKNKRYGCVNCYGLWKEREKLEKQLLEKYIFLDEEILPSGNSTREFYTIKCRKCGHIRKQSLNNLKHHLLCGCETGMYKWDADDFNSYFIKKFPDYLLMESYKGMQEKHLIKHECGFIFKQRLSDFFDKDNRHICPKCKKNLKRVSKGHEKIRSILDKKSISFYEEYFLHNSLLRFDFYFEIGENKYAIEYNGEQHYRPIEYFGGEESFKQQQERDNRKRQYCLNNNINLLEISYKEKLDTIENIISDFLNSTTKVDQVIENTPQL